MTRVLFCLSVLVLAACASAPEPAPAPAPQGPPPGSLGGLCGGLAGQSCNDANAYCAFEADQYGVADAAGVCREEPDICTAEYAPVCGFDGESYGNACNVAMEGVSVRSGGLCPGDRGTTAQ